MIIITRFQLNSSTLQMISLAEIQIKTSVRYMRLMAIIPYLIAGAALPQILIKENQGAKIVDV